MALDPTVGGANSDTYATVAELKTYLANRYPTTTLSAASDAVMENVLRAATRLLDASFDWTGAAVASTQALCWPRSGMTGRTGFAVPTTVNPQALKDAQCEFACGLYAGDRLSDNPALKTISSEQSVTSIKAGSLALTFAGQSFQSLEAFDAYVRSLSANMRYLSRIVPDAVRQLLIPSWYLQPSIKRPVLFSAGGTRC
jgi:DnaT-like ssDNA binding protein